MGQEQKKKALSKNLRQQQSDNTETSRQQATLNSADRHACLPKFDALMICSQASTGMGCLVALDQDLCWLHRAALSLEVDCWCAYVACSQ